MVAGGGHAWFRGGVGMRGCLGGVRGCQGGMHGWGGGVCGCWGACMVAGGCIGYDKIRSMSGRYASYWNEFLF